MTTSSLEVVDVQWINDERAGIRVLVGDTMCWQLCNIRRPKTPSDEAFLVTHIKLDPQAFGCG